MYAIEGEKALYEQRSGLGVSCTYVSYGETEEG